jgi:hypothetical protein
MGIQVKFKADVMIEYFLDGKKTGSRTTRRTIYQLVDGSFIINWLTETRPCEKIGVALFYAKIEDKSK